MGFEVGDGPWDVLDRETGEVLAPGVPFAGPGGAFAWQVKRTDVSTVLFNRETGGTIY